MFNATKINLAMDICPVSEFRANTNSFLEQVKTNHRPLVLTQYGKSSAVVVDVEDYQSLTERLELLEDIEAARDDSRNGRVFTQEEAKARVMKKLDGLKNK